MKEDIYNEVIKILTTKYGVDEDDVNSNSILGDDLNLGTLEIQDFLLDVSDKYGFEYEDLIEEIEEELEELTINETVNYIYDALKLD
ncbi:hypothetical protein EBU94_00525 [bacterium]|jgi:hypothetical protein|nr:hypothetical protein [bacterium]NBO36541.1 hypothetical protein [bacterium]